MRVATAIKLLQDLDPEAQIACQWYEKDDMTDVSDKEWELAIDIFDDYDFTSMRYAVEQAIGEAKEQLAKEGN